LNSRRSADRAAQTPYMPWTPPPGGVDEERWTLLADPEGSESCVGGA